MEQEDQALFAGMPFEPVPGAKYKHDYCAIRDLVLAKDPQWKELDTYRFLALEDLWFLVYFIMQIPVANHPFVVQACRDVEDGPASDTLDLWAREHFKAVDIQEPVLTTAGWRKHGDLSPGDYVYGADGQPTRVVARTPVYINADCYRVRFSDGYSVVVSGDHLWTVGKKSRRRISDTKNKRHYRDYHTITTRELAQHHHAPDQRYSVRLAQPIQTEAIDLPLDPYVLGCWLGDGTSASSHITSNDPEIIEQIRQRGFEVIKKAPKYKYLIRRLQTKLRVAGVFQNKHIPDEYLTASASQRWELLRGLMDTDGTCDDRGTATFCSISDKLASGVYALANSLGLAASFREVCAQVNGEPYQSFQVSFQAYKSQRVFWLSRKHHRCKEGARVYRDKFIVGVEPVESRPVSCIQVEASNGLYLIGDKLTVTHNSTIITVAETIQCILKNPEERVLILSYALRPARKFLNQIKQILETSEILKACFPDVLYQNPGSEAFRWSEESGLYVRRKSKAKEPTVDAGGLTDGMPTGGHYTRRVYDDIVTIDLVGTPEMMTKVKENFDLSENLGAEGGTSRIVGTTYHHNDPLVYIRGKNDQKGEPLFYTRVKPATADGTPNGKSVLLGEDRLAKLRTNTRQFYCQQLLDPTPRGTQKLDTDFLITVHPKLVPDRVLKFMTIDPAGDLEGEDSWAITVCAVEPFRDDLGASRLFLLDAVCEPMDLDRAISTIVDMYCRNGRITALGVEKVGISTTEIHIAAALRARGKHLTLENKGLCILRPAGRKKEQRIEQNLVWPLNNGKIHVCSSIPAAYVERLKLEMERFPYWRDDFLDALSYQYDMVKDYKFAAPPPREELDAWDKDEDLDELERITEDSWMTH